MSILHYRHVPLTVLKKGMAVTVSRQAMAAAAPTKGLRVAMKRVDTVQGHMKAARERAAGVEEASSLTPKKIEAILAPHPAGPSEPIR